MHIRFQILLVILISAISLYSQDCIRENQTATARPVYHFPTIDSLPDNPMMPDPFSRLDGTRITRKAQWPEQRQYLLALVQHYLYGHVPPRPRKDQLEYTHLFDEPFHPPHSAEEGVKQSYRITIKRKGKSHSFDINLWRPIEKKRYPTLINNFPEHGHADTTFSMSEGVRRGYMVVEFNRRKVAPDEASNADRQEGIFRLYPEYDFHTIAAWAWVYQPIIDVLDQLQLIDMDKIIATGHSRGGQTAMAAGIFDQRIDMIAPSTGGPFSVGSTRQRDPEGFRGTMDYPANFHERQPHWYHPNYYAFENRQNKQPWDAPTLVALVAPRPLINLNAIGDGINNGLAHEAGIRAGMLIYEWFDAKEGCRIHWRDNENRYGQKGHDQGPEEFLAIFDYADEFFFDKPKGPSTYNRAPDSESWLYDPSMYPLLIDWSAPQTTTAELLSVTKIWDAGEHNAFTDLIRFRDTWFCVFREAKNHWGPGVEGHIRVITSKDGESWHSAALISQEGDDLRDAKISVTPDQRLMLLYFRRFNPTQYPEQREQTFARFSSDGQTWSEPVAVGNPDRWLWRVTWHQGTAYGIDYGGPEDRPPFGHPRTARLLASPDGVNYEQLAVFDHAGEATLCFQPDGTALCLIRSKDNQAFLGSSAPPFTEWTWRDLNIKLGGPNFIRLPDGRWVAAGRLYDNRQRTALLWLDPETAKLKEILTLPSGGDTSYPGLVWHDGLLWMSYYSSHEDKTSIYLAKVKHP
jgi:hypothetical protein